jgi:hypothetical protein
MPRKGGADDAVEIRMPADATEHTFGFAVVGVKFGRITCAPLAEIIENFTAKNAFRGLHDFKLSIAVACAATPR